MDVSTLSNDQIYALRGAKARVPKGTQLRNSTHPDYHSGKMSKTVGRDTVIRIHNAHPYGGANHDEPIVSWAGNGGYWKDVALADIELLPAGS